MSEGDVNAPEAAAPAEAAAPTPAPVQNPLPTYAQNLLYVRVPVSVTLAQKKQSIKQITELAPGSLIQFDKSCEEALDLCVGDHRIAQGLAVKVGEKFGLRVNELTPPVERLRSLRPNAPRE
jgi:flagellar motor switch protein FliN